MLRFFDLVRATFWLTLGRESFLSIFQKCTFLQEETESNSCYSRDCRCLKNPQRMLISKVFRTSKERRGRIFFGMFQTIHVCGDAQPCCMKSPFSKALSGTIAKHSVGEATVLDLSLSQHDRSLGQLFLLLIESQNS